MPCFIISSETNGWILMGPAQINHWKMEKNCSDFGDLYSIFMVTGDQRMLKMAFLHSIL